MQETISELRFLDATRLPQQQLRTSFFHDSFEVRLNGQHRSRYVCQKYAIQCAQTKYLINYGGTSKPPANIKYFSRIMVKFKDLQGLLRSLN